MWEGPSWLVAEREAPVNSPPNKWPRTTTPPNKRNSLLSNDSGIELSFSSPPITQKNSDRPSPLRTPRTRPIIHLSSTPSPFRAFRLSASPASNRVLKLSNSHNVIDVKFSESTMDKNHGQIDVVGMSSASRTLDLPSTSKSSPPRTSSPYKYHHLPETPSKCFSLEESGLFEDSFPMMTTSTPLKHLNFDDHKDDATGPSTISSISPLQRLIPDTNYANVMPLDSPFNDTSSQHSQDTQNSPNRSMISGKNNRMGNNKRSCYSQKNVFRSPKKPLKPFSKKWLQFVTGNTKAQKESRTWMASTIVLLVILSFLELNMAVDDWQRSYNQLLRMVGSRNENRLNQVVQRFSQNGTLNLTPDEADRITRVIMQPLADLKIALLIVDFQNDFVSGSLSIKNGDSGDDPLEALPSLNALVEQDGADLVVYTQDWHPSNHISFYEHARNSDRELSPDDKIRKLRPFDIVRFEKPDTIQVLYPTHCIQGTWGAQLHPQMVLSPKAKYVRKGTDVLVDSYSAFRDNSGKKRSELEEMLRSEGINAVLACGLAYDICVMHTLKDSANLGFLSAIVTDCSKGLSIEKMRESDEMFRQKNIAILTADMAHSIIDRQLIPIEWIESLASRAK